MNQNILYVAADFSIAKPAISTLYGDELKFAVFPQKIDSFTEDRLRTVGVEVTNRNLDPVDTKDPGHIMELTKRYTNAADMITAYLMSFDADKIIFSSEGLSYASKGRMTLELAGAKYVLLSALWSAGVTDIITYSPTTIKSTAGCAGKGKGKDDMISAFKAQDPKNEFMRRMKDDDTFFRKKTAYIHTIDDIVDSYWCIRTMASKLNFEI